MSETPSLLHVLIRWQPRRTWCPLSLLERVAREVCLAEGFRSGTLDVVVVGRRAMRTLHARHLGLDGETDVLAFDLGTDRRRKHLIGDIALCADVAWRRTRGVRRAARAELALYLTHGILHLAGYDDHTPAGFRRMHAREDRLLQHLGFGAVFSRKP